MYLHFDLKEILLCLKWANRLRKPLSKKPQKFGVYTQNWLFTFKTAGYKHLNFELDVRNHTQFESFFFNSDDIKQLSKKVEESM